MQLVELQENYNLFSALGAEVVAISTETLQVSARMAEAQGIRYPILADPEHRVSEAYGVYNLLGDHRATPSVFVVNDEGTVTWRHVGRDTRDRPDTEAVLEQLERSTGIARGAALD